MKDLQKQLADQEFRNIVTKLKAGKTLTAGERRVAQDRAREMSGGKRYLTGAEIGSLLGISRQAGDKKIRKGCLVTTFEELVAWEEANTRGGADESEGKGEILKSKLRKITAEADRLELRLGIERGELLDKATVADRCTNVMALLIAELSAMMNDLPGQLVGLAEIGIRDRLANRVDLCIANFKDRVHQIPLRQKK